MKKFLLVALAIMTIPTPLLANEPSSDNKIYYHDYNTMGGWNASAINTIGNNLIVDFGSLGLLKYENGNWTQLSQWDARNVWTYSNDIIAVQISKN
jgi:hypothetical protein